MKNKITYTLLLFLVLGSTSMIGQRNNRQQRQMPPTGGEYVLDGNGLVVEDEIPDISFGTYNIQAALYASSLIQQAQLKALSEWREKQYGILKKEIEAQLHYDRGFYQTFSNYDEARNTYFRYIEKSGVYTNHQIVRNKYKSRYLDKANIKSVSLRNLKLLQLRKNELQAGNINSSSYDNFNYNGTPLDQIQSLSQLQSLWANELNTFSEMHWKHHNDYYTYLKADDFGNITDYNHTFITELLNKQLAFYNQYDDWKKLDLIQAYLNRIIPPLALPAGYISPQLYATPQYLESYAIQNRGGGYSIFSQNHFQSLLASAQNNMGQYVDSSDLYASIVEAWEREKEMALENELNNIEVDDGIFSQLTGKAKCIYEKLKNTSTGFRNAIQNFDGEFPVSHLTFQIDNTLDNGNYGITYPPSNFNTTIKFSNVQLEKISDLGAATAFAHEIIHAEIFRKMLSAAQRGDLTTSTMTAAQAESYVNSLKDNFPGLYDYYLSRWHPTWNHNMMASHYRSTIVDIIKEFDNNRLPISTYEAVAWVGLGKLEDNQTTPAWDALTFSEKQAIELLINENFSNGPSNCQ